MRKEDIHNLIHELVAKLTGGNGKVTPSEENGGSTWFSVEVDNPHLYTHRDGEGLHALNHIAHRLIEARHAAQGGTPSEEIRGILIDINGFQKKHVENIRAIAHMMSERARYFRSNIEIDPMTAFERRIVHEFLAEAEDLETESVGVGRTRHVVIKYKGKI